MKVALKSFAILGVLGLIAAPGYAFSGKTVKVDVPFEFTAGNTSLPAGEYSLQQSGANHLQVRDADREVRATVITRPRHESEHSDKPATVIFHQYGTQHFLSGVEADAIGLGSDVARSRSEREASRQFMEQQRYTVAVEAEVE